MKSILILITGGITAGSLLAQLAGVQSRPRYTITDLGVVGGPPGGPYFAADNGLVGGASAGAGGRLDAVLWYGNIKFDISKPGLGGPNTAAFGVNERGQAVGAAQSLTPNSEDFCGFNAYGLFHSNTACLPFLWQGGLMFRLPTLGGANGTANMINNRGQVVGWAENSMRDPNPACTVSQFEPVIWENGRVRALPTYPGDPDGVAASINDSGQVVGASGTCSPFNLNAGNSLAERHALLWENGVATNLGNLGGTGAFAGIHACAINNRGQVAGHSDLTNDATFHGFVWTRETHMRDIGTLAGDFASVALGINDSGAVVGASLAANFSSRAFLWQNGLMTDLNTLVLAYSKLTLVSAVSINSGGQIVGTAQTSTGEVHGFLASPSR